MQTSLLITDNFYHDPDRVRQFALSQEFNTTGNYPGSRTVSFLDQGTMDAIQTVVWNAGGKVTQWYNENGYTRKFSTYLCVR